MRTMRPDHGLTGENANRAIGRGRAFVVKRDPR